MTGGSNGLSPVVNLSDRTKCPTNPTKRKWCDGDQAKAEAESRSKAVKIPIVAYLCSDCGCYHLTKSKKENSITLSDGKYSVGEFQKLAPTHPVFATPSDPEPPIVPGDHATRVKFARRYLDDHPGAEPTTEEMCEAIGGCTKDALRKVMAELGYHNTRGRTARWRKTVAPEENLVVSESEDPRITLDLSYDNDAPEPGEPHWIDLNHDRVRHLAVGDLIEAYAAAGLAVRIQVMV